MRWYLLPSLLILVSCNVFAVHYAKNCKEAVQLAQKSPAAKSCGYSYSCSLDGGVVGPNPKTHLQFTIDPDDTTLSAFCLDGVPPESKLSCAIHNKIPCILVSTQMKNVYGFIFPSSP